MRHLAGGANDDTPRRAVLAALVAGLYPVTLAAGGAGAAAGGLLKGATLARAWDFVEPSDLAFGLGSRAVGVSFEVEVVEAWSSRSRG